VANEHDDLVDALVYAVSELMGRGAAGDPSYTSSNGQGAPELAGVRMREF
jgi:hypothetical protein